MQEKKKKEKRQIKEKKKVRNRDETVPNCKNLISRSLGFRSVRAKISRKRKEKGKRETSTELFKTTRSLQCLID